MMFLTCHGVAANVSENNAFCEATIIDQCSAAEQIERTQFIFQYGEHHCFSVLSAVVGRCLSYLEFDDVFIS